MKIAKESLALYSLDLIRGKDGGREYRVEQVANAMGISPNTFNLYVSRLVKEGLITKQKKRYLKDLNQTVTFSQKGSDEVQNIENRVGELLLTTDRHNVPKMIKVSSILGRIKDPLERVFFLSLYHKVRYFDLPMYLNTLRMAKMDVNMVDIFSDLEIDKKDTTRLSFVESFYNTGLWGKIDKELPMEDVWKENDTNTLLVLAEAYLRQAKIDEARVIHRYITDMRGDITQNQWFKIQIDEANALRKEGKMEEAMEFLDKVSEETDNKKHNALIKSIKGLVFALTGDREKALELYRSAIASFNTFGLPILLSIVHNYRGYTHFINDYHEDAEKDWIKARRYAKDAGSRYGEAMILPNLADIAVRAGKFDLAEKYLKRAHAIFEETGDHEGFSIVEYNYAIFHIFKKDIDSAIECFDRSNEIAYPLPSPQEKKELRGYFIKCALEKGYENIESRV